MVPTVPAGLGNQRRARPLPGSASSLGMVNPRWQLTSFLRPRRSAVVRRRWRCGLGSIASWSPGLYRTAGGCCSETGHSDWRLMNNWISPSAINSFLRPPTAPVQPHRRKRAASYTWHKRSMKENADVRAIKPAALPATTLLGLFSPQKFPFTSKGDFFILFLHANIYEPVCGLSNWRLGVSQNIIITIIIILVAVVIITTIIIIKYCNFSSRVISMSGGVVFPFVNS